MSLTPPSNHARLTPPTSSRARVLGIHCHPGKLENSSKNAIQLTSAPRSMVRLPGRTADQARVGARGVCLARQSVLAVPDRSCLGKGPLDRSSSSAPVRTAFADLRIRRVLRRELVRIDRSMNRLIYIYNYVGIIYLSSCDEDSP